jgi:glutamine cyclotransferase
MFLCVGKWNESSTPTSFGYEVDDGIASKNHSSGNNLPLSTGSDIPVMTEGKLEDELPQIIMSNNEIELDETTETFVVLEEVKHDRSSFTQGLSYADDNTIIFQTTGINGKSKVQRINPITFDVELSVDIDSQYFGEGSAFYRDPEGNGRLIHITWQTQTGFIYDADTLKTLKEFKYTTTPPQNEGWGITYNPSSQEFIVSDGSKFLYFWDRDTLVEKRKVSVTRLDGKDQDQMNELEYIDGLVCCNIWYDNHIICVDPMSGKCVREYDMSSLSPENLALGVLNGIALGKDHVLLTGKNWDQMYKVVFPDWKTMFNVYV